MQRIWGLLVIAACDSGGSGIDAPGGGTGDGPGGGIDAPAGLIDASPGVGEPPEMMGMTLYHNQVRAMVQTATPLPALQWDPALAATASAWVAMCRDTEPPMGLVDQICEATGGPCKYTGKSMKESHTGMNVKEEHFNALVEDLVKSLDKFKVGEKEKGEPLGALGGMKGDIVTP